VHLPFSSSTSVSRDKFELIHCDLWTSPIISNSGFRYYLVIVDDYSHFYWSFPLRQKSCVPCTLANFYAYVCTHFDTTICSLQTDNGTEFLNSTVEKLPSQHGTTLCLSCPYTSQQNSKSERAIRTINDKMRTLMFQAHLPESFWAETLATSTFLLNRRPSKAIGSRIPYTRLHDRYPPYSMLQVFGCLCYPNISSTVKHKLRPRCLPCVFLGYLLQHRGYRCFDPVSRKILISRHVIFDESVFLFQTATSAQVPPAPLTPQRLDFLFTDIRGPTLPGALSTAAASAAAAAPAAAARMPAATTAAARTPAATAAAATLPQFSAAAASPAAPTCALAMRPR
jgi:histone deacetylase 1/2